MGGKIKVILLSCLLGLTLAEVTLNGHWEKGLGWIVACSWQTKPNDTLQSVRMYRNELQFLVYRPEKSGAEVHDTSRAGSFLMTTYCSSWNGNQKGNCVVQWDPHSTNATEDTYRCEISGERPTFRLEEKDYTIFASPTAAVVNQVPIDDRSALYNSSENHRLSLNCTSSGLPPPRLLWTVEGRKIPEDFTHTMWNSTARIWDSWSSYNPQDYNVKVVCTPEAITKSGRLVRGSSAEWVKNNSVVVEASNFFVLMFSIISSLLR